MVLNALSAAWRTISGSKLDQGEAGTPDTDSTVHSNTSCPGDDFCGNGHQAGDHRSTDHSDDEALHDSVSTETAEQSPTAGPVPSTPTHHSSEQGLLFRLQQSQEEAAAWQKQAADANDLCRQLEAELDSIQSVLKEIRFIPRAYFNNYMQKLEKMGFEFRAGHLGCGFYRAGQNQLESKPLNPFGKA